MRKETGWRSSAPGAGNLEPPAPGSAAAAAAASAAFTTSRQRSAPLWSNVRPGHGHGCVRVATWQLEFELEVRVRVKITGKSRLATLFRGIVPVPLELILELQV